MQPQSGYISNSKQKEVNWVVKIKDNWNQNPIQILSTGINFNERELQLRVFLKEQFNLGPQGLF
jgi:hypothetical protein